MPHPVPAHETRTIEQLREQLEVERELAQRLLAAPRTDGLYSAVYGELLRRVPHHPSLAQRHDPAAQAALVDLQLRLLAPFLTAETRFLEVGGGDGALAIALSGRVRRVVAVEASSEMAAGVAPADNVEVLVRDAPPYPLPDGSVDLAFTCHFLEHLRDDDALMHLREMHRLLAPGGRYVCVTPHRLWGPHDISRYFADVPEGLHLHEYSQRELLALLARAGFRRRRTIPRLGGTGAWPAHAHSLALEALVSVPPPRLRRRALDRLAAGTHPPLRPLEQVMVVASR